jgi:acyl-CoA thioesterase-1
MKKISLLPLIAAAVLAVPFLAAAQTPAKKPAAPGTAAKPAKKDPAMEPVVDDPKLPRVLLIGDSISIGYTVPVRKLMQGKANVHRILTNGGPTSNGLAHIKSWLGDTKWDVIHFNWGLHDLKFMDTGKQQISIEDYEKNLRTLVAQLKATNAKLIWCNTTPVPDAKLNPPRKNTDVLAYNAAASRVMADNKIPTNDLYSHADAKLKDVQIPANVHFTASGSEYLATKVVAAISEALGIAAPSAAAKPAADEGWQPMFDGKSLAGWKVTDFAGHGEVRVENNAIRMEAGSALTGVTIATKPPTMNFEIAYEAMKISGSDFFASLTFPFDKTHCTYVLGGWGGAVLGISSIDGADASENETTKFLKFDNNRWYRVRVRVTPGRIQGWLDDEQLVNLETKDHKISMRSGEIEENVPLGLATWQTTGLVRNLRWRPVK